SRTSAWKNCFAPRDCFDLATPQRPVKTFVMAQPLTAEDLLPLVEKLPQDEQVRLAHLALRAARDSSRDAAVYRSTPVRSDEFSQDEEGAAWDGEGWEAVGAPR